MSFRLFRPKPKLPIPKFRVATPPDARPEPKPQPLTVDEEVIDPTQTRIDRFKELLKKRLKNL